MFSVKTVTLNAPLFFQILNMKTFSHFTQPYVTSAHLRLNV